MDTSTYIKSNGESFNFSCSSVTDASDSESDIPSVTHSSESESDDLSTREILETIASKLKIKSDRVSDEKLEKRCFKKVLGICEKGKWEKLRGIHKFVPLLVGPDGRSVYEVVTTEEEANPNFFESPPENLVFKGGGAKGLAYIGVLMFLEEQKFLPNVIRIAGASAGAIIATLLAVGYSSSEILQFLTETPTSTFVDLTLSRRGLCKGEAFRRWLDDIIKKKTNIKNCTFGELRQIIKNGEDLKHLHIFISKVGKNQETIHISSEEKKFKNLIISDVVRASISLPIVFPAHILHIKNKDGKRVVCQKYGAFMDGGFLANYPIKAFDKKKFVYSKAMFPNERETEITNKKTLGFFLHDPKEFIPQEDTYKLSMRKGYKNYKKMRQHAEDVLRKSSPIEKHRMVKISNLSVKTVNFFLNQDGTQALIECGKNSSTMFLRDQEQQSENLKLISKGKKPKDSGAYRKVRSYNYFRHQNSNLSIEISGNRITIYQFSQFPIFSRFGASKKYTLEAFIQIDKRFSIFSHLQRNEEDEAQDILETNRLFFENCFLWDQFIKLVIEANHPETIEFFDSNGFSFNLKSDHPLWYAQSNSCWRSFKELLKIPEIDVKPSNPDNQGSLLHTLSKCGHAPSLTKYCRELHKRFPQEYLDLLMEKQPVDNSNRPLDPLDIAVKFHNPLAAEVLIENGANFEEKIHGWALKIRHHQQPFISVSKTSNGKETRTEIRFTPSYRFALNLFSGNFKGDVTPSAKMSLLEHCCRPWIKKVRYKLGEALIQNQLVPFSKKDIVNKKGNGPLLVVLQSSFYWQDKLSLAKLLLSGDQPDDVNQANDNGDTPLILTAKASYDTLAYLLTIPSIDVNQQDSLGNTALHYAISEKGKRRSTALIKHSGIDLNIQNNLGQTPLHLTSSNSFIKLLVDGGASDRVRDNSGKTPSELREFDSFFYKIKRTINS